MCSKRSAGTSSEQQHLCITPLEEEEEEEEQKKKQCRDLTVPLTKVFGLVVEHIKANVQNLILYLIKLSLLILYCITL
jgi:hypothetical protein